MRVILHIGMHKTGTTALQSAFAGYERDGVVYADLGNANHTIPLRSAFDAAPERFRGNVAGGRTRAEVAALGDETRARIDRLLGSDARCVIFSGEGLSLMDGRDVDRMKGFFEKRRRIDWHVLGYAREPLSFCASALAEELMHGLDEARLPRPLYRERFQKYRRVFGIDRVEIAAFDRDALVGGDIVTDFAQRIGVAAPVLPQDAARNERLSREAADAIFAFATSDRRPAALPEAVRATRVLERLLEKFGDRPFRVPADAVAQPEIVEDCRWLHRATGIRFAVPAPTGKPVPPLFHKPDWIALAAYLDRRGLRDGARADRAGMLDRLAAIAKSGRPTGRPVRAK